MCNVFNVKVKCYWHALVKKQNKTKGLSKSGLFTHLFNNLFYARRAEPLLTQIKADRTVVVSPVFDKVNFDDLKVIQYLPAAHAFDWALWCMYESFTPEYYQLNDGSLPGK